MRPGQEEESARSEGEDAPPKEIGETGVRGSQCLVPDCVMRTSALRQGGGYDLCGPESPAEQGAMLDSALP